MSETKYTIVVLNSSLSNNDYAIFTAPPRVDGLGTTSQVYTNAWVQQHLLNNGYLKATQSVQYYAWTGSATSTPAPGVTISSGMGLPASLGTEPKTGSTFDMTVISGTAAITESPDKSGNAGSFAIKADTSFYEPNNTFLIGLGAPSPQGLIKSVATILAKPNTVTNITPTVTYYAGISSYSTDTIVDFQTVTDKCGKADFSSPAAAGKTYALITHKPDGSFQTAYFANSAAQEEHIALIKRDTAAEEEKLNAIHHAANTLSGLLQGVQHPIEAAAAWPFPKWIAKAAWPFGTAPGTADKGAQTIKAAKTLNGYNVVVGPKYINNDKQYEIGFWLTPPSATSDVKGDWRQAVQADSKDGAMDKGADEMMSTSISPRDNYLQRLIKMKFAVEESFDGVLDSTHRLAIEE